VSPLKRECIRKARAEGWVATLTRKSHVRLRHPSGAVVIAAGTPSSRRAGAEMLADLARALKRKRNDFTELRAQPPAKRGK
jgi:predicted RNA binding protein YcfA (HicA-like mRNA interferase family)